MDNNSNNNNVQRYQASSTNLNTVISNPTVNINDTMNMNIQNMSSNQGINNTANGNVNSMINPTVTAPNIPVNSGSEPTNKYINTNINNNNNNTVNSNINNNNNVNTINTSNMSNVAPSINRTYVTNEVKPKKKNTSIKMGSEFKTALLIVVILLIFILFLPIISDLIH